MSRRRVETIQGRPQPGRERLFTANFVLASLVTLASFTSFYFLLATLPVYIVQIGGTESEVGLIIGVFAATAVLMRPFVGKLSDEYGKRSLILAGTLVLAVCSGLYALARAVPLLLGLRVIHGVGWASFGTATSALVADVAPRSQRGAAMGYYGMFSNLAMAVGPAVGVALMNSFSFTVLFISSAAVAMLAVLLSIPIRDPMRPVPLKSPNDPKEGVIERTALFPSAVLALFAASYGAVVSFLPIYAVKQGIGNPGVFFTVYAVTLLLVRGFTGQLSDRYGRAAIITPGLLLGAAALVLLAFSASLPAFLGAAVLYGLAFASIQPSLMALVVDRSPPRRRGAAMGTFSSAMDLGIGGGSFVWGFVAQAAGYGTMYLASAGIALVALGVFVLGNRR